MDFDPFSEFLCFKVPCLWYYCHHNSKYFKYISSLDFRLPNLDEAKILNIHINFWDRKSAIKRRVRADLSVPHASYLVQDVRIADNSPRLACLLTLFTLARIACPLHICDKINKFALLYLGPRPNNKLLGIFITLVYVQWNSCRSGTSHALTIAVDFFLRLLSHGNHH